MGIKNIILSKQDKELIEKVILKYGRIVNFNDLKKIFGKDYTSAEIRNRVSFLARAGWLKRLKRGLYAVITDVASLSSYDISELTIAQALNRDSYISFENALQHYSMFDQSLSTVGAVTFRKARKYKVQNIEYRFFKIKKGFYFGFSKVRSDIGLINMASKEKAVLDLLYFRSGTHYLNLIWEKLNEYQRDFDFGLFKQYAGRLNREMARKTGFLLDKLGVNTESLLKLIQGQNTYGRLTAESRRFDSKWKLYYDDRIIK